MTYWICFAFFLLVFEDFGDILLSWYVTFSLFPDGGPSLHTAHATSFFFRLPLYYEAKVAPLYYEAKILLLLALLNVRLHCSIYCWH